MTVWVVVKLSMVANIANIFSMQKRAVYRAAYLRFLCQGLVLERLKIYLSDLLYLDMKL